MDRHDLPPIDGSVQRASKASVGRGSASGSVPARPAILSRRKGTHILTPSTIEPPSPAARANSTKHPFAPKALRVYVWCMALLVLASQGARTYQLEVQHGHLGGFGRIYYAVVTWRAGGELYAPNAATPETVGETATEMINVASPMWHLVVLPFTYLRPGVALVLWVLCNVTV